VQKTIAALRPANPKSNQMTLRKRSKNRGHRLAPSKVPPSTNCLEPVARCHLLAEKQAKMATAKRNNKAAKFSGKSGGTKQQRKHPMAAQKHSESHTKHNNPKIEVLSNNNKEVLTL